MYPIAKSTQKLGSVLVVGGNGFLGHHIVKQLLEDPTCTAVSVMDINTTRNRLDKVNYYMGDVTVQADVDYALAKSQPDIVFDTASPIAYGDHEWANKYFTVNVDGCKNLFAGFKGVGTVKGFVYTSSAPIIAGSGGSYSRADETYPTLAVSQKGDPYHVAKAMADKLVLDSNDPTGIRTACIRPTAMYGEGDRQMIPHTLDVVDNGQQTIWLGPNTCLMDTVYVGHCARAHILAAYGLLEGKVNPNAPKVEGEAFNITDDTPIEPWTFCKKIWTEAGDRTPLGKEWKLPMWFVLFMTMVAEWIVNLISFGKRRPKLLVKERIEFCLYTRTYSIQKAVERLGYKPLLTMDQSVSRAVQWAMNDRGRVPPALKVMPPVVKVQ